MKNKYPHLFTPLDIGNFSVPNRICHVPTDVSLANPDGSVNNRVINYYKEVAKGGTGFIVVGASTPDKSTGRPTVTCIALDEDPLIPGLAHLADAMHQYGAKCAVQIQHPGRQSAWPRQDMMSVSDMVVDLPSSASHNIEYTGSRSRGKAIRAMTIEEIYDLIEKFAEAAWRVQQAGFDSVELHGAHGYMIAQFMSPYVNKRNDRFGGSFKSRMRFVQEIIARIQYKCGEDFPIGIRYSGEEFIPGARDLDESVEIAVTMEECGLSYLDISAGIFEAPAPLLDPAYYPEGWNTYTAEEIKKHVSIPVITSHTLRTPDYCEKILAEGKTDMVGLARQMIADPHWANKSKMGQKEEIRKCISCLVGCWQESLMVKKHVKCSVNADAGREMKMDLTEASAKSTIAVVGGGPGGMETARVAALRGHDVTIFEASGELGGAILCCCTVPGKNKMRWYADWLRKQVGKLNIKVQYRSEPGVKDLQDFDVVILATGGTVERPDIPGIDSDMVTTFDDVLRCESKNCEWYPKDKPKDPPASCGDTVLIWGDHFGGADTAEKLGTAGKKVYIVTENPEYASWMEPIHKDVMMKRFNCGNGEGLKSKTYKQPVEIFTSSTILEIRDNGSVVIIDREFNKTVLQVDTVVLSDVKPDNTLYNQLLEAGVTIAAVGDLKEVRNLGAAVREGAEISCIINGKPRLNGNNALVCDR